MFLFVKQAHSLRIRGLWHLSLQDYINQSIYFPGEAWHKSLQIPIKLDNIGKATRGVTSLPHISVFVARFAKERSDLHFYLTFFVRYKSPSCEGLAANVAAGGGCWYLLSCSIVYISAPVPYALLACVSHSECVFRCLFIIAHCGHIE